MKWYNIRQSTMILVIGFALLWMCLYVFVFPHLVGGGPAKVPLTRDAERQFLLAMEVFKSEFGTYPSGDETNIVRVLAGNNPKKTTFLNLNARTNALGQYVDAWKVPYKFRWNATNVVMQSAGIDQVFDDADDIVLSSTNMF